MRRRTILLISSLILIVLGAGMYGLGYLWNKEPTGGGANIGAGMVSIFGEIVGFLGLAVLVIWAIAALIVRLKWHNLRSHGQEADDTDLK